MTYANSIDTLLTPRKRLSPLVVDLFSGCGGFSLGFEAQGFRTTGFELLSDCVETYNNNLMGDCVEVELTRNTTLPKAPVVIGGPPCQPFSVNGKQLGAKDARNCLSIFVSAIEQIDPDIWILENVPGIRYRNEEYFNRIVRRLKDLGYFVTPAEPLNAINFGVPQNRQRIFVVGHRGEFSFPLPQKAKITAGDALGDLALSTPPESLFLTESADRYIARYEKASNCVTPRDLKLDQPARTLTCRNLAGATGDMHRIKLPDGRRRRLLVREAARLQSFPDWFEFAGGQTSCFNQIGNAVPPLLALFLAKSVRRYLNSDILDKEEVRIAMKRAIRKPSA